LPIKQTYIFRLVLTAVLSAIALPATALAGGVKRSAIRIGVADARPAQTGSLTELVAGFHHELRVELRRMRAARHAAHERAFAHLPGGVSLATLDSIASCESGGDPTAVSADGTYRGKYQFDFGTWESVGGTGDPAAAPEAEQDYRAALLYERAGSSPWPICG
jgi:transglycosylase-like protein